MDIKEFGDKAIQVINSAVDIEGAIRDIRKLCWEAGSYKSQPVDNVIWVDLEKVQANDYNPNSVAQVEMGLLHLSISRDGYTQPVVTIYDPSINKYVIVDGFHRYITMKSNQDIRDMTGGRLPIVVIEKDIKNRMSSTIRHNRARGKHTVTGMSNMVFGLLTNGWDDATICNELGMSADELVRLKHITGFSKLFSNTEYSSAWIALNKKKEKKQKT